MLATLIEHRHIVEDDTVEQAHFNAPHRYGRAELLRDSRRHSPSQCRLHGRDMHESDDGEIKAYRHPKNDIYDASESLQAEFIVNVT